MAGPLTWRNVDAPDFRGAVQGYQVFGNLMDNATRGLGAGIQAFQQDQTQLADRAVLANALQFQNAPEYQQALRSGQLLNGIDPSNVSLRALGMLDNRTGDLVRTAGAQEELGQLQYSNARTRSNNLATDAASPAVGSLLQAGALGDRIGMQAAMSTPEFQALSPTQKAAFLANAQGAESNTIGNTRGTLGNLSTAYDFNKTRENDAVEAAALNFLQSDEGRAVMNSPDALALLERSKLDPRVRQRVAAGFTARVGDPYGPNSGTTGGESLSAPGTAGTRAGSLYDTVVGFGKFGKPPKPFSSMTGAEAIKYGQDVLIPATRNNASLGLSGGKGTSAMGGYQFTGETLQDYMPRVLKDEGGINAVLTPANQDKLAKAIFEDRKDGNLKATWQGLPDATPGAYKNMSFEKFKDVVTKAEVDQTISASTAKENIASANLAGNQVLARASQNQAQGIIPDLEAARASTETPRQVFTRLSKEGGDLRGMNERTALNQIQEIMQDTKENAAVAGAILSRNVSGTGMLMNLFGRSVEPDSDGVKRDVAELRAGGSDLRNLGNKATIDSAKEITSLREQSVAADAEVLRRRERAKFQPAIAETLPRYEAEALRLRTSLKDALSAQAANPALQPEFQGQIEAKRAQAALAARATQAPERSGLPAGTLNVTEAKDAVKAARDEMTKYVKATEGLPVSTTNLAEYRRRLQLAERELQLAQRRAGKS